MISFQPEGDTLSLTVLETGPDGQARFRQQALQLNEGNAAAQLSALFTSTGVQFRRSPVGFRSDFHCTSTPQWLVVLRGRMEIGLQDGSTRSFGPGECFFSNDILPPGESFNPTVHGHCSRQLGNEPLETLFVRATFPAPL